MSDGEARGAESARGWLSLLAIALLAATLPPLIAATLPVLSPRHTSTVVASGSMAPSIRTGDVVVTRTPTPDTRVSAPAVVLHRPVGSERLVLHRVVGIDDDGRYVTRGDANRTLDAPVPADRVVGVGALVVPLVGTPLLWHDEGRHLALLVLLVAAAGTLHLARTPQGGTGRLRGRLRRQLQTGAGRRALAAGGLATVVAGATLLGPVAAIDRSAAAFTETSTSEGNHLRSADRTPPAVTMGDPGPALSAPVTLTASATDAHSGVATVAFEYAPMGSGAWQPACSPSQQPWSCEFDPSSAPPGGYELRAVATDVAGNTATSTVVATTFGLPQFRGIGPDVSATSRRDVDVLHPTGTEEGDLLLLLVTNRQDWVSAPSGDWQLLLDANSGSGRHSLWWRQATSATSTSVYLNTNTQGASARIVAYEVPAGRVPIATAHGTFPFGVAGTQATMTPAPNVTTDAAATVIGLVTLPANNQLGLSDPRAFAMRGTSDGTGGFRLGVADVTVPDVTSPASPTWQQQSGTVVGWAWATIAFR